MTDDKIEVLIADDHPVVRQGLRALLELEEDIEVVGEAQDGVEAVEKVEELVPDVVLMDLAMPRLEGVTATRRIKEISPKTRVLVLTSYAEDEQVFGAMKAGATGYLLKDVEPQELIQAIRCTQRDEPVLSPLIAKKLIGEISQPKAKQSIPQANLTPKEREVLGLVAKGKSNKEIADSLSLSEKTVKNYIGNILSKLYLSNRTEAALYALQHGLVQSGQHL
jgi:NarL family two-component system response regulator LiaR